MSAGGLQSRDTVWKPTGWTQKERESHWLHLKKYFLTFNKIVPQSSPKNLGWTLGVFLEKMMPQVFWKLENEG